MLCKCTQTWVKRRSNLDRGATQRSAALYSFMTSVCLKSPNRVPSSTLEESVPFQKSSFDHFCGSWCLRYPLFYVVAKCLNCHNRASECVPCLWGRPPGCHVCLRCKVGSPLVLSRRVNPEVSLSALTHSTSLHSTYWPVFPPSRRWDKMSTPGDLASRILTPRNTHSKHQFSAEPLLEDDRFLFFPCPAVLPARSRANTDAKCPSHK